LSLSAAVSARSSSASSNGKVGFRVTFGGLIAFAGLRSIHSDSSQNRRNPRRYSRRLTADVAANFHVFGMFATYRRQVANLSYPFNWQNGNST
jgi:hypothetical protein